MTCDARTGVSGQGGHQDWSYDSWGRTVGYTNFATGNTDTRTSVYDTAGRVASVSDPLGTTVCTYDGADASGVQEYRGLVTKVGVFNTGGTHYVSAGVYDAAGVLVEEHLPGRVGRAGGAIRAFIGRRDGVDHIRIGGV